MATWFVTSSGTGLGKTLVTCALCHQLRLAGRAVNALKPVISGFAADTLEDSDSVWILRALRRERSEDNVAAVSPWRFREPLSPDMAAARESRRIELAALTNFCRSSEKAGETLLIEGVGGVMVPLDERHTVLDWMHALGAPVLVVVGSYLGTLSHTLTAVDAVRARALPVAGVIVSESPDQPVPLAETVATIERFVSPIPVRAVPRVATAGTTPWLGLPDLTDLLAITLRTSC